MLLVHEKARVVSTSGCHLYLVSVGLVILALAPRLLLHNFLDERSAMVLFAPAVMASASSTASRGCLDLTWKSASGMPLRAAAWLSSSTTSSRGSAGSS